MRRSAKQMAAKELAPSMVPNTFSVPSLSCTAMTMKGSFKCLCMLEQPLLSAAFRKESSEDLDIKSAVGASYHIDCVDSRVGSFSTAELLQAGNVSWHALRCWHQTSNTTSHTLHEGNLHICEQVLLEQSTSCCYSAAGSGQQYVMKQITVKHSSVGWALRTRRRLIIHYTKRIVVQQ